MADEFPPARDTDSASASTSPDWNNVPFDVGCARCGHDLRGQSEPVCPACKLEFDWADAVPIERLTCARCGYHLYGLQDTRCPECGTAFTWEGALDRYQRNRKPIFEYQWHRRPVRSFIGTWWLALRPWKMWRVIDLHDPPRLAILVLFSGLLLLLTGIVVLAHHVYLILFWRMRALSYRATAPSSWMDYWVFGSLDEIYSIGTCKFWLTIIFVSLTWSSLVLLGILVLQQSLRRARIKTGHILRVVVYACITAVPAYAGLGAVPLAVESLILLIGGESAWRRARFVLSDFPIEQQLVPATCLTFATLALAIAVRCYLRLRHPVGVAVGAMLIGLFGTGVVCMCLFGPDSVGSVLLQWMRTLGIDL